MSGEWDWICLSPKKFQKPLNTIKPLADDHFNLGLAYNMIGQSLMAENHYRICLSINPYYSDAFEKLAEISKSKGDMKKYYFYLNELGKIKSRVGN